MDRVAFAPRGAVAALALFMGWGCSTTSRTVTRPPQPPPDTTAQAAGSPEVPLRAYQANLPLTASAQPAAEWRVMSFNLRVPTLIDSINHWTFRKKAVIETIRRFDPDLLGTQECVVGQADFLRHHMPGYEFFGVGRNDGRQRGEMCGIFYKSSQFQRTDGGHFWLSQTPAQAGSRGWGALWPRMVTWVKLQPRDGPASQPLFMFNTHFDVFSSRARRESAKLLRQRIDSIAGGALTVVTGDFNIGDNSDVHRIMTQATSISALPMRDAYRAHHPARQDAESTHHGFGGARNGRRIDWIIASDALSVVRADIDRTRIDGRYPSDHFPVTATLRRPLSPPLPGDVVRIE